MNDNADLRALVRSIPDHPKPGIVFRDITTLLLDAKGFAATIDRLSAAVSGPFDLVAGIEARGFIFAAALAERLGAGVLLIRKRNKLPGAVIGVNYALEYGEDRVEMHADACRAGAKVLLVDDLIATGGTAVAAIEIIRLAGGIVTQAAFAIDLPELGGAARLRALGVEPAALMAFDGD